MLAVETRLPNPRIDIEAEPRLPHRLGESVGRYLRDFFELVFSLEEMDDTFNEVQLLLASESVALRGAYPTFANGFCDEVVGGLLWLEPLPRAKTSSPGASTRISYIPSSSTSSTGIDTRVSEFCAISERTSQQDFVSVVVPIP